MEQATTTTTATRMQEAIYTEYDSMARTARKFGNVSEWAHDFRQRSIGIVTAAIYMDVTAEERNKLYELVDRLWNRFDQDAKY